MLAEQVNLRIPGLDAGLAMKVYQSGDLHISRAIADRGIWEPGETQFILHSLRAGDHFVDVGANIGYFTLLASRLVGEAGHVSAFEPDPQNFALLQANCQLNDCANVSNHEAALSNENSQGALYLSEFNKGDHTIYNPGEQRDSLPIKLVRGSDVLCGNESRIQFLKIDTQGSEYQVLEGLLPALVASLPELVMMVEFSPNSMSGTGVSGEKLLQLLDQFLGHYYLLVGAEGDLLPITREELGKWVRLTQMNPEVEGFINLVFSGEPLESGGRHRIRTDLGLYDNALDFLLADTLPSWDGRHSEARGLRDYHYFAFGWSFPEDWGVWSEGGESRIKCFLHSTLGQLEAPVLRISGRYFGELEATGVYLDGQHLGDFDLRQAKIPLPPELLQGKYLTLSLKHLKPQRPCDLGQGEDDRSLKFGLESLSLG